jgi:hypothetical protein
MNWDIDTPQGMVLAMAWTHAHLERIRQGGIWFVPRVASTYCIDHANKTVTRTGLMPDPAITKVLRALGWTVIEKE